MEMRFLLLASAYSGSPYGLAARCFVGLLAIVASHHGMCTQDWPRIVLPREVQVFDIGQQVTVNGLPMRAQGFVSTVSPSQLAEKFRQTLGKPLVENVLGNKLILGRLEGEHYLTVQIEPAGAGSRGVAATAHVKAAYDAQSERRDSVDRWLARLPSGSRLFSQVESRDGQKLSHYTVIVNSHSEALNRDRMIDLLAEDGFIFDRESSPDEHLMPARPEDIQNGKLLFFKGKGKEAMVTIHRDSNGHTSIVVNAITVMERLK
ncbi:hypothetical protein EGT07_00450 [Herbaspirillum sp. HC18]|nr:hypothetical protein EGT07_00450 [Herbaspirillum sp. HC18]